MSGWVSGWKTVWKTGVAGNRERNLRGHGRTGMRLSGVLLLIVVNAMMGRSAHGQTDFSFGPTLSTEAMLANQLVFMGSETLRSPVAEGSPTAAHFENSAALFDMALALNPSDAEVWHTRAELARYMEDTTGYMKALASYRKLSPDDDFAGWELMLAHLDTLQTLEARVAEVERLLTLEHSQRMSPALRSRMAWYVSFQALQRNDTAKANKYLKQALTWDPSNIAAVQLAFEIAVERKAAPKWLGVFLMNLVEARPDDPKLRFQLAQLMLSQAAYTEAATQFDAAKQLAGGVPAVVELGWATSLIASEQYEAGLERLNAMMQQLEAIEEKSSEVEITEENKADAEAEKTAMASLRLKGETLRLVALQRLNRDNEARASMARLDGMLVKQIANGVGSARGERVWLKVLFDHQVDEASIEALGIDDPVVARIRGHQALEAGRVEDGEALLEPLIIQSDLQAEYLLARHVLQTNPPDGLTLLQELVAKDPAHVIAVMASLDLRAKGFRGGVTDAAKQFAQQIRSWDGVLLNPDPEENSWSLVKVDVDPTRFGYLEPIKVKVTLRNTTSLPLSLGEQGVLPATLALYITARQGGVIVQQLPPVIVSMARQLRLRPREMVQVEVPLDNKALGWLLTTRPTAQINFDITAVYNPAFGAGDRLTVGLVGAVDHTFHLERVALPVTVRNVQRWQAALMGSNPMQRMESMGRFALLGAAILEIESNQKTDSSGHAAQEAVDWINGSFETLDVISQAWLVRLIQPGSKNAALFAPVLDVARQSEEPLLRIVYLISQIQDSDNADLVAAAASEQVEIATFAKNHREVLLAYEEVKRQQEQAAVETGP